MSVNSEIETGNKSRSARKDEVVIIKYNALARHLLRIVETGLARRREGQLGAIVPG